MDTLYDILKQVSLREMEALRQAIVLLRTERENKTIQELFQSTIVENNFDDSPKEVKAEPPEKPKLRAWLTLSGMMPGTVPDDSWKSKGLEADKASPAFVSDTQKKLKALEAEQKLIKEAALEAKKKPIENFNPITPGLAEAIPNVGFEALHIRVDGSQTGVTGSNIEFKSSSLRTADSIFSHSTSTNPHLVTFLADGRYLVLIDLNITLNLYSNPFFERWCYALFTLRTSGGGAIADTVTCSFAAEFDGGSTIATAISNFSTSLIINTSDLVNNELYLQAAHTAAADGSFDIDSGGMTIIKI